MVNKWQENFRISDFIFNGFGVFCFFTTLIYHLKNGQNCIKINSEYIEQKTNLALAFVVPSCCMIE